MRLLLVLLIACSSTKSPEPTSPARPALSEATSLDGKPLARPALSDDERAKRERALAEARALPDPLERAIWTGRRLGYLHRYRDAIDVFTKAIAEHPTDARLYRHRGHRYITIRKLPEAIADLARARELIEGTTDAIEPDGMPNAANTPTSTLHGNIYYHLALAHHLQGDDDAARGFFQRAFDVATTDDSRVAAAYWLAILGQAPALPDAPTLLENHAYWDLIRLFRKQATIDEVRKHDAGTVGYGIARFHLANGDRRAAVAELREVVAGEAWPSFGFIAAEALLLRTRQE